METSKSFLDLPLREQNRARTRLALLDALTERLTERTIDEISVAELARAAGVSQATFFNYFSEKSELLTWFIEVWSVEVSAVARRAEREQSTARGAIEALLESTAQSTANYPNVMLELIAHQARMPQDLHLQGVGRAERLLRLPYEERVEELSADGLGSILEHLLQSAVDRGELPAHVSVPLLTLAVASIFFGVPLVLARHQPDAVGPMYRSLLEITWNGARHCSSQ